MIDLTNWTADVPSLVLLALSMALYSVGLSRVWQSAGIGKGIGGWQAAAFAAGWVALALAALSPLAVLSEVLFSAHMTQHEVLMVVAAPLLSLSNAGVALLWALPHRWRVSRATPYAAKLLRGLTMPLVVCALHALALWTWHLPSLYEHAVRQPWIHALQHVSFVLTACLFWWGLTRGRYGRMGYGVATLYIFATTLHSGALGALFTVAPEPLYDLYRSRAAEAHIDPLADQQVAGLLMWVPACAILSMFGLALFVAWLGELERRNQAGRLTRVALRLQPPSAATEE